MATLHLPEDRAEKASRPRFVAGRVKEVAEWVYQSGLVGRGESWQRVVIDIPASGMVKVYVEKPGDELDVRFPSGFEVASKDGGA